MRILRPCLLLPACLACVLGQERSEIDALIAAMGERPEWVATELASRAQAATGRERARLEVGIAEALCRAGRHLDAIARIESLDPPAGDDPRVRFWLGVGRYAAGQPLEAAALFDGLLEDEGFPLRAEALHNLSLLQAEARDYRSALAGLATLIEEQGGLDLRLEGSTVALLAGQLPLARKWLTADGSPGEGTSERRQLLLCALADQSGAWDEVERICARALSNRAALTEPGWFQLWSARAVIAPEDRRDLAAGVERIVRMVEEAVGGSLLEEAFGLLEACGPADHPAIADALDRWSRSPGVLGQWASFYAEVWFPADRETLLATLRSVVENASHPARGVARLQLAREALLAGNLGEGYQQLADLRADRLTPRRIGEAVFLEGSARFAAGQFTQARELFRSRRLAADPLVSLESRFNRALVCLAENDRDGFEEQLAWMGSVDPDLAAPYLETLVQTRALHLAAVGSRSAPRRLREAIDAFPESGRTPSLRLALAEWHALARPPDYARAEEVLAAIRLGRLGRLGGGDAGARALLVERREALSLLLDAWQHPDDPEVARRLRRVADAAPAGGVGDLLGLALGRLLLEQGRSREAMEVWIGVTGREGEAPRPGPAREIAAILAGSVALETGDPEAGNAAVTALGRVIAGEEGLAPEARLMQARILAAYGSEREALAQLTYLRENAEAGSAEAARAALLQGELFFRQAARASAQASPEEGEGPGAEGLFRQAADTFDSLATGDASPVLRQEALYRRARCLEKLADEPGALQTYFHCVDLGTEEGALSPWFYRSGFRALRLLERRDRWESAILLAEKLTAGEGPEAGQAREELNRLRLNHFEL